MPVRDDAVVGAIDSNHAHIGAVDIVIVAIDYNILRLRRLLIVDVVIVAVDSEGADAAAYGYVIVGSVDNE